MALISDSIVWLHHCAGLHDKRATSRWDWNSKCSFYGSTMSYPAPWCSKPWRKWKTCTQWKDERYQGSAHLYTTQQLYAWHTVCSGMTSCCCAGDLASFFCHSFLSIDFYNSYKTNESNHQSIIFHKAQWSLKVWRKKKFNKNRTGIYWSIGTKLCVLALQTPTSLLMSPLGFCFFDHSPLTSDREDIKLCALQAPRCWGWYGAKFIILFFFHGCSLFDSLRTFSKSWKKITSDGVHLGPVKGNIFMKWETGSLKDVYYSTLH